MSSRLGFACTVGTSLSNALTLSENNLRDLIQGDITWGQYNRHRQEIQSGLKDEVRKANAIRLRVL